MCLRFICLLFQFPSLFLQNHLVCSGGRLAGRFSGIPKDPVLFPYLLKTYHAKQAWKGDTISDNIQKLRSANIFLLDAFGVVSGRGKSSSQLTAQSLCAATVCQREVSLLCKACTFKPTTYDAIHMHIINNMLYT